jgi:RNA polymerase sigma-70 factor (ECF subfamily)
MFNEYFLQLARFAEGMLFDSKLADDLVQDLFLNLWKNAENLTIDKSIKGYLYASIRNKCLNELKKLQIYDKNLLQYEGALNSGNLESDNDLKEDLIKKIMTVLDLLPKKMKEIVKMKYLLNKKHREIAESLSITENTVNTQLTRAKKKMRNLLY